MQEVTKGKKLRYETESFRIRGCIYEVNRKLGIGFLEAVYQEALEIELKKAGILYEREKPLPIIYDGTPLKQVYRADFVCFGKIIVEIKAVHKLTNEHKAQVFNYLAATGMTLGFLVNFCVYPKAEIIRIIR
ncbi:MAG: GxxExxY protein [Treponema sp.]|jgi:GxxExxY protein|nr:GxxExxY protein [Treponema sp.]